MEEGDLRGEPLFLIHGFPDLWYGWRHQIKHFAKLGYRVLAVDCLGYGQTVSYHITLVYEATSAVSRPLD